MSVPRCRIGFDVGGTFTDFVLLDEGTSNLYVHKALTTSEDPAAGSLVGLDEVVSKAGLSFSQIDEIVHGTTIVTNAVIERTGARTALITTRGFRDIMEMGTEQRYDIHDVFLKFPDPLVPRRLRYEVSERIASDGSVIQAINLDDVRSSILAAVASGATSLAVCLIHSYKNDTHERAISRIVLDEFPNLHLSLSSAVCAEIREYDRSTTTVANAYVMPLISPYIKRLENDLRQRGFNGRLLLMQSSGELASTEMACRFPIRLLESGPAGGAIAASYFGRLAGYESVIAFDMGGTTAKVCLIQNGRADVAPMMEAAREHRFKRGSGLPIRSPVIDMIEIGAGGGSVAGFDELGLLKVGPRSAGSSPGPACYGLGGIEATVTDANLALGYLSGESFLGGRMRLLTSAALAALLPIAQKLGCDEIGAASGIFAVVCENMASAARAHIIEKGRDPRDFAMVAFGGAGPAHALQVSRALGIATVIVPPASGAASALGFLGGRLGHEAVRSSPSLMSQVNWDEVTRILADLEADGRHLLVEAGVTEETIEIERSVELRLSGQIHNLQVSVPLGVLDAMAVESLSTRFALQYRKLYARDPMGGELQVISWRVRARAIVADLSAISLARLPDSENPEKGKRNVWNAEQKRFIHTPVYARYSLRTGMEISGPAVIEEDESTTVIQLGDHMVIGAEGEMVITLSSIARKVGVQEVDMAEAIATIEADPVGLEIMWSRLITISEECWLTVIRTAFSLIIGEMQDFACEILDADGESLAHSPRAMPVFNLTLMGAVKSLLKAFPPDTLIEGDILVTNDPWLCAGHLFDIAIVTPVFYKGRIVAITGSIGHVSDIGGTKDRNRAREIFDEGFQIPPMKLYRAGVPNVDLFTLLGKNVRNSEQVFGDIAALVSANAVGAERIVTFLDEYGLNDLRALAAVIQKRAEHAMREAIRALPNGIYKSECWPQSVGLRQRFPVKITVEDDNIQVDYEGSPPELLQGGLNCTFSFTEAKTFFALKCLLTPHIRASAGCYKALTVKAPYGSMLNCSETASVGIRHLTGSYLVGNIFNAFANAMPKGVQAFSGLPAIIHFYGKNGTSNTYSDHIYIGGGQGGSDRSDGKSGMLWPTSASNGSVEVLETRAPILVVEKAFIQNSGGPGRHRGGLGQQMQVRRLREDGDRTLVNSYPEGIGFTGHALFGGRAGGGAHSLLRGLDGVLKKDYGEGAVETLSKADDIIEIRVGGGSGYGDPLDRSTDRIEVDVLDGYITVEVAIQDYGCLSNKDGKIYRLDLNNVLPAK